MRRGSSSSFSFHSFQLDGMRPTCSEVYENQRWQPYSGFKSEGNLLPTDPARWGGGGRRSDSASTIEAYTGRAITAWEVKLRIPGTDKNGWEYALDFQKSRLRLKHSFSPSRRRKFVRRRLWVLKADPASLRPCAPNPVNVTHVSEPAEITYGILVVAHQDQEEPLHDTEAEKQTQKKAERHKRSSNSSLYVAQESGNTGVLLDLGAKKKARKAAAAAAAKKSTEQQRLAEEKRLRGIQAQAEDEAQAQESLSPVQTERKMAELTFGATGDASECKAVNIDIETVPVAELEEEKDQSLVEDASVYNDENRPLQQQSEAPHSNITAAKFNSVGAVHHRAPAVTAGDAGDAGDTGVVEVSIREDIVGFRLATQRAGVSGFLLSEVAPGGAAECCGLAVGDVLRAVGGADIAASGVTSQAVVALLRTRPRPLALSLTRARAFRCARRFVAGSPLGFRLGTQRVPGCGGFGISYVAEGGQAWAHGWEAGDCLVGVGGWDFGGEAAVSCEQVVRALTDAPRPLDLTVQAFSSYSTTSACGNGDSDGSGGAAEIEDAKGTKEIESPSVLPRRSTLLRRISLSRRRSSSQKCKLER